MIDSTKAIDINRYLHQVVRQHDVSQLTKSNSHHFALALQHKFGGDIVAFIRYDEDGDHIPLSKNYSHMYVDIDGTYFDVHGQLDRQQLMSLESHSSDDGYVRLEQVTLPSYSVKSFVEAYRQVLQSDILKQLIDIQV